MEEFKQALRVRRETTLSGLKHKMDALRTENQFMKELLQIHNIECPPLSEICNLPQDTTDNSSAITPASSSAAPDADGEVENYDVETKICEKCEALESEVLRVKTELSRTQSDLQEANAQLLEKTTDLQKTNNHCQALKDVNRIIKELIGIRDQELSQLKEKLKEIEQTMSEREAEMLSEHLRTEYTRQLENIRRLKTLYEQRARSADAEIEILKRKLADKNTEVDNELLKNQEKEQRIAIHETEITRLNGELYSTRDALKDVKNEMELLQNDLQAINMLFTRILTNKDNFDLDRLKNVLTENRMLLSEVTTRSNDCSIIADSVLPKLLCDLIVGAFAEPEIPVEISSDSEQPEIIAPLIVPKPDLLSTDEIIENLPKIWRILTELLIHQKTTQLNMDGIGKSEDCYKTVDTPTGPQLVLSVSKTFIKLKDLILEKKGLQKETKRLKVLNEHLQQTLNSQEDRLGAVSVEVTKTWHLVNRMQRQHRQLHTKEQVLRYHLQQKRRMVNVLKDELESCRHKWTKAREKNESSEIQWKMLRDEFTSRKGKSLSVESGFSDDQATDEDAAEGVSEIKPERAPLPEPVDPIDETLEQMFYRLNAIHEANTINFQPVLEEPQIVVEREPNPLEELVSNEIETNENTESSPNESPSVNSSEEESRPEASPGPSSSGLTPAEEESTTRRSERIRRLEEQCKTLFDKMTSTAQQGDEISNRLDQVHIQQQDILSESSQSTEPIVETEIPQNTVYGSDVPPGLIEQSEAIAGSSSDQSTATGNDQPGESSSSGLTKAEEEYTARRNDRIKRLEEQCKALFDKMTSNKKKGEELSEQLDKQLERGNSNAQENSGSGTSSEREAALELTATEDTANDNPPNEGGSSEEQPGEE